MVEGLCGLSVCDGAVCPEVVCVSIKNEIALQGSVLVKVGRPVRPQAEAKE